MFEGFLLEHIEVGPVRLPVRYGGAGPAVVLLHGDPRTHVTWHRVAPLLAGRFTVVCPDLRGATVGDIVTLMNMLGHKQFAVVGHDRWAYVAFRAAMDHPDVITHLCVLDAVPIGEALARCDVGRTVACPVHVIWSARDGLAGSDGLAGPDGGPIAAWRAWAGEVTGEQLDYGHQLADEASHELATALIKFLETAGGPRGGGSGRAAPPVRPVPAVIVEVLAFGTDGQRVRYEPLHAELSAGEEPDAAARRLCGIEQADDGLLHSTSWRFEEGAVVLTYAALRHGTDVSRDGHSRRADTDIADSAGSTEPTPDDLDLDEVAAHACRHLAFLAATDPDIVHALEGFPVIERLIRRYTPDVAGRVRPDGDR